MARTRIRIDQADGEEFLSEEEAEETFMAKDDFPYADGSLVLDGYLAFNSISDPKLIETIDPNQTAIYNHCGITHLVSNGKCFDLNIVAETGCLVPKLFSGTEEVFCTSAILHYERLNRIVFINGSISWELQDRKNSKPLYIKELPFKPLDGVLDGFSLEDSRGIKERDCFLRKVNSKLVSHNSKVLSLKKIVGDKICNLSTSDLKTTGSIRFKGYYLTNLQK